MTMFPQLFESVPDALILVDRDGRIVLANRNAESLFGYPPQGLAGMAVEELMPQAARERHRGHRGDYMRHPRVRPMGGANMNLIGQRRDGRQFPVEIALSPINSEYGPCYLASVRDISESQRTRQALVRAHYDALAAQVGHLALASATGDRVITLLPELLADVLQVPRVAVVLMRGGEPAISAAVGMPEGEADALPEWLRLVDSPLSLALAGERPLAVQDSSEPGLPPGWPADAVSGAIVPLLDRDRPLGALLAMAPQPHRFGHDELQLLQTVGNLIAAQVQRRRTEEQLAHAQRLEAVGQLTGGVAHDFNNLLTVVSGSLQLLEVECGNQPAAREIIDSALRSVERGAELTAKLLAFARRQHLVPRAVQPQALLADLVKMLRSTLGDAVRLRVDCTPDVPAVFADPSQLDSALVNLALNARDAMPQGGLITIDASERWVTADPTRPEQKPGHYVAFTVADNGHGMSPEVLAHAFEPFFTTKPAGRGSGLGLSMVYGFVKQSGGHLSVASDPGHGTRVCLFLPVGLPAGSAPASVADRASIAATRPADTPDSRLILVVEDQAEVRDLAATFLRSAGYRVVAVGSASAALEQLALNGEVALLFSDIMLGGGMTGVELANAARALRPRLGVLLTSGYDDPAGLAASVPPAFKLLRKPYRLEQLAAAIRRQLPPPLNPTIRRPAAVRAVQSDSRCEPRDPAHR